jgi:acyl-coenzyme A thioesterase PaaI-like protein
MTEPRPGFGDYEAPPDDDVAARLAVSVRRLMDASVLATADEPELTEAIVAIDTISARLEGPGRERLRHATPWPPREAMAKGDRRHNPMAGPANPLAPPMRVQVAEDGSVYSHVTMRPIHEGPPGGVHGGFVAALLDQLLGAANIASGVGAMTAELTIRYRRPTPVDVPLVLSARTDSIDERRVHASGEITADGVVTARAEGLFIRPTEARLSQHERIVASRAHK